MPTIAIMDTRNRPVISRGGEARRYQRHSLELKRRIVERTLTAGASVARIAREHGINANQVFAWRKLYREGRLGGEGKAPVDLVPVSLVPASASIAAAAVATSARARTVQGRLWVESPKGSLSIEGEPDAAALRLVLEHLLG